MSATPVAVVGFGDAQALVRSRARWGSRGGHLGYGGPGRAFAARFGR